MIDDSLPSEIKEVKDISTSNALYITFKYFGEILTKLLGFQSDLFEDADISFDFSNTPVKFSEFLYGECRDY